MAQVTVELGRLLTTNFKLFDFDYQFDDTTFKAQLEQTIIDFYYDYEIGQETPDMFKRKFKARWTRIMPYYNTLYNTTLLTYNPLSNQKLTEVLDQLSTSNNTESRDLTGSSTGNVTTDGTTTVNQDIIGNTSNDSTTTNNLTETTNTDQTNSDYPQQPIAGGDYASGAQTQDSTTTNTGTVKLNGTGTSDTHTDNTTTVHDVTTSSGGTTDRGTVTNEGTNNTDYTKTIEGITGITYPELIQKHRDAILRINDMIINEMKPCFILTF